MFPEGSRGKDRADASVHEVALASVTWASQQRLHSVRERLPVPVQGAHGEFTLLLSSGKSVGFPLL